MSVLILHTKLTTVIIFVILVTVILVRSHLFAPKSKLIFFFQDKFDVFVPAHFLGWWAKTLILRDYWMTLVLSVLFEINEYSLQHQLPNFSECWWDHVSFIRQIYTYCLNNRVFNKN